MVARAETTAATGERILAAAWRAFAGRRYEDVRMADVAADARTTAQTLHARFGTKDDLFVAAWVWRMLPAAQRRDTAPAGDVRAAVRFLYDSYEKDGDAALRLLAQEDRIPAVRAMTDAGRAWHRAWVERTFLPGRDGRSGRQHERRVIALIAAADLQVWKLFRRELKLPRKTAEQVVVEIIAALKEPEKVL
jgi:AcrR family transcriptional regulator